MTSRISTFGAQQQAVAQMLAQQTQLARTQQQLSTGLKLNSAKDNPVDAGVAVALDRAEAEYLRFGKNADVLTNRLTLQENALSGVNDILARLREMAVQINSSVLDQSAREAFVPELRELKSALLAAANTSDGQGRFLFGGTRDDSTPFVVVNGVVQYNGDQSQRRIEVAPGVSLADADPGSELFLRIRAGNGVAQTRPEPGNAGTAVLKSDGFRNQVLWDGGTYRIEFNAGNYQVLDGGGAPLVPPVAGPFVSGEAISFAGYQVTLEGEPADGDAFVVQPAEAIDAFAIIDRLTAAALAPDTPAAARAERQNAFYAVLQDLEQAGAHLIDARAGVGARLSALDRAADEREGALLTTRSTLSQLRDLDYAEAISRLSRQSAVLEAAQATFTRVQSLSLFSFLR